MDFQTMRLYGSMAIILGCFIFLYPKLLHPVVMTMFGQNEKPQSKTDDFIPPALRDKHMAGQKAHQQKNDIPDEIKRNMRQHGPHPGMRAAAAEQSKTKGSSGGKGGMMGVILPMYAVGIVIYLVYTLFKVFGKKDGKNPRERSPRHQQQSPQPERRLTAEEEGKSGDPMTPEQLKLQLNELQLLANKVKEKDLSEMDMNKLQDRLAETEAQMTKILSAMHSVQNKMGDVATAEMGGATADTGVAKGQMGGETSQSNASNNQGTEQSNSTEDTKKEPLNVSDVSTESSSPESDSYEIINKSDRESSGEDTGVTKVETVLSKTSEEIQEQTEEEFEGSEEEGTDVMMEEKTKSDEEENVTVRKRTTKKEGSES